MNFGKESETVEFKESLSQLKEGLISLTAMLNKSGQGTVYFGVNDDGELIGLKDVGKKTIHDISQAIGDGILPRIIPTVLLENKDGRDYILVSAKGYELPYSFKGEYRIRSADEDKKFPYELLRRYFNSGTKNVITAIPSYRQNYHFSQLKALLLSKGVSLGSEESFLQNEGLVNEEGKFNIQASLLADESDFAIKVAQFSGEDKGSLIKRTEFGYKSLALSMEQIIHYVQGINETRVMVGNALSRREESLFDFDCFREALVNAFLHTRWEEATPPIFYVFSNRIEVLSYGGLPLGLSKEDFYLGRQKVINESLMKVFSQLGYAETTGYGVPLIVRRYGKEAFDFSESFLQVTIPFAWKINAENAVKKSDLTPKEKTVLDVLKEKPSASRSMIAEATGFNSGSVAYAISSLERKGYIVRSGSKKTGFWIIKE